MDLSTPTILLPRAQIQSTPSMLLQFIVNFVLYLSLEKNENKQKEAEFGPFFKKKQKVNFRKNKLSRGERGEAG